MLGYNFKSKNLKKNSYQKKDIFYQESEQRLLFRFDGN